MRTGNPIGRFGRTALLLLFVVGPLAGCGPSKTDEEALSLVQDAYGERYEFEFAPVDNQYVSVTAREGVAPNETEAREIYGMFRTVGGKFPDGRTTSYIFMHFYQSGGGFLFQVGPSAVIYEEVYY